MPEVALRTLNGSADPHALPDAKLTELINLALATHAREDVAILVKERLLRQFARASVSQWEQVADIERLQAEQVHLLYGYGTFAMLYEDMRREWLETHDPVDGVFISKNGFSTYEQWAYLRRHYGEAHGFSNEQLAKMKKSVLERMAGTCARWDHDHNGDMDQDVFEIITDSSYTHENCLEEYRRRKEVPPDNGAGVGADDDREPSDREPSDNTPDPDGPVSYELLTDTGILRAWIPTGTGDTMLVIGRMEMNDHARPFVLSLAQQARIRIT